MTRRLFAPLAAAAALPALLGAAIAPGPASVELAVKASYLAKLAPFVQWPQAAFAGPAAPLAICLVGQDEFGPLVARAARGQRVNGRPLVVRRPDPAAPIDDCHILFAGRDGEVPLRAAAGQPVLTVTDGEGGIVRFVTARGRVRFAINAAAAQASGIGLSSKLLALAVRVDR